ncbi:MAG TPA: hypothetical protein VKE22_29450 [Haliangiales bacterium]|nr:hypothetical protein [Haliangiales bacterium]
MSFLDERERDIVDRVLAAIGAASPARAESLARGLEWLGRGAGVVAACPAFTPLDRDQAAGAVERLVDLLAGVSEYDFELHVPTKAMLGQAYLVAKINFLRALESAAREVGAPADVLPALRAELGQSIYTRLGEDLIIAIVTDRANSRAARRRGAELLHRIWEQRMLTEIDDFAPVLEAAWEARNKVKPVLGTMLGSHEIFRLFQEARDERFLDYFVDADVTPEQGEAFEEFLFGLAHEDIGRLRAHLAARGQAAISPEEAGRVLGRDSAGDDGPDEGPVALFASYKRRKLKAGYRALTGAPGPKHTAEEYVMLSFLNRPTARLA